MQRYMIPKTRTRTEIRVSNSVFITSVAPAFTVKEAQAFIREIRAEMPDASHHVYAFKIGYGASVSEGMSDDGEPSGTSGPPALAVLRGSGVGDVVLVITRYFGGTKLGTGGLVAAYTAAAKAGFEALETEEKVERIRLVISLNYSLLELARRLLGRFDCEIESESFAQEVSMTFTVPEEFRARLSCELGDLSNGAIVPRVVED
ncbi:MAG: YigZ family protein [Planctomycetota bacterium]